MNLQSHPELVDRLAASYALGTLRGGARRRFETLARNNPQLRVAALMWQERFVSMTELQQPETPDPNVWKRIENVIAAETAASRLRAPAREPAPGLLRRVSAWWRAGALAAGVAAVAAMGVALQWHDQLQQQDVQLARLQAQGRQLVAQNAQLASQLQSQPEVRYVSILTDERATPAMLVTFDPRRGTLSVKRVGNYQEGPRASLQLWGLPANGAPQSLGVLNDATVQRMPMPQQAAQMPLLAISLEPHGGVPGDRGPTGPVLWKGAVLQTPL
jgi:anti-sigma-K factor RskA